MSSWINSQVVRWPAEVLTDAPGWVRVDCGCCNGVEWGGPEPRPCRDCGEEGWRCIHVESESVALWPGGPLLGTPTSDELAEARAALDAA